MNTVRTREQCEAELAVAQKRFDLLITDTWVGTEHDVQEANDALDRLEAELKAFDSEVKS